jgi:hypothetical protein
MAQQDDDEDDSTDREEDESDSASYPTLLYKKINPNYIQ